jgi:hypothetical protein
LCRLCFFHSIHGFAASAGGLRSICHLTQTMDLQLRRKGCGLLVNNNFTDEFLATPRLPLPGGAASILCTADLFVVSMPIAALAGGCGLICRINSWTNFGHTVGGLQLHFGIELCRFYFIIPTSHFQVVDRTTRCCYEMQPSAS